MNPFKSMAMGIAMGSKIDLKMDSQVGMSVFSLSALFLTMSPSRSVAMGIATGSKNNSKMDS